MDLPLTPGTVRCLLSAALFGASAPAASVLVADIDAFTLAGLLYLGAAVAVAPAVIRNPPRIAELVAGWRPLAVAVILGGAVGPAFLIAGLAHTDAATASILLNTELVATVVLAAVLFREHIGPRVATGSALLAVAGLIAAWQPGAGLGLGSLFVVAACVCWGFDNCVTAGMDQISPESVVLSKGLLAGGANVCIGLLFVPDPSGATAWLPTVPAALVVGALGYACRPPCGCVAPATWARRGRRCSSPRAPSSAPGWRGWCFGSRSLPAPWRPRSWRQPASPSPCGRDTSTCIAMTRSPTITNTPIPIRTTITSTTASPAATTTRTCTPGSWSTAMNTCPTCTTITTTPGTHGTDAGGCSPPAPTVSGVDLPVMPPVSPMLAAATPSIEALPTVEGGYLYEPKWDGFRAVVFRDGDEVEIGSRGRKPLTRYFPELVETVSSQLPPRCVVDGEIVVIVGEPGTQRLDWDVLAQRIHPASSRVTRLSQETPAALVVFDLLAVGDEDLTERPFGQRRARLEQLFADGTGGPSVHLSRVTADPGVAAAWFREFEGAGLDGVVAKPNLTPYQQGRRVLRKVKHKRSADVVVLGYRIHKSGEGVGSLLLGLYADDGDLCMVGGSSAFSDQRRLDLIDELAPLVQRDEQGDPVVHPGEKNRFSAADKNTEVIALRPELVVEVAYDQMEKHRFRHTVQITRFRVDREPQSCTYDQLESPAAYDFQDVLSG